MGKIGEADRTAYFRDVSCKYLAVPGISKLLLAQCNGTSRKMVQSDQYPPLEMLDKIGRSVNLDWFDGDRIG